jgi:tRNA modification GTPase
VLFRSTGEDVVELNTVGAPPLFARLVARLVALGAVPAEPGEFTRRAFESGRLSLEQAEGVLALVEARNAEAARAAHELVAGGGRADRERVREELAELVALAVASLDFSEDDSADVPRAELASAASRACRGVARLAEADARRPLARAGARAVLIGAPNAGKSSLFNRLAGARALVSPHAGTTRDPLHAELGDGRFTVELVDTAGLELGRGAVGRAAQERGRDVRASAALGVWVVDATVAERESLARERAEFAAVPEVLLAWNKIDRGRAQPPPEATALAALRVAACFSVSALSGAGVEELGRAIVARAAAAEVGLAREVALRHREALGCAASELELARAALSANAPLDLALEHLREALAALDRLSGRSAPEELLDRIFARFCVGK